MRDLPVIDDPWVGKTLDDRFEVLGLLGKGGMGAIYRCRELRSGAELAIKIILGDLEEDPEVVARFEREIRANCEVVHPNVVHTLGHGRTDDGTPYFAMELLRGRPLDEVLDDDGDMPSARVAHLGRQIALGLHAAHKRGIVHRDLKPTNVIVADDDTAKVFDFGLSLQRAVGANDEATRLTEMGLRIGTPLYMAPEYIQGGELDARSDLYALGVLLYELCTGRVPFGGSPYQVLHRHANEAFKPIDERVPGRHPAWLRDTVEQLLAKKPHDRPATGAEVARMLREPAALAPVTHGPAPTPAAESDEPPEPDPPEPGGAPPPPVGEDRLGSAALAFVGVAAAIWHGFGVGVSVGSDELPLGRSVATMWTAARVLSEGGDPYAEGALQAAGAEAALGLKIPVAFGTPSFYEGMAWTHWMDLDAAWATWLGIQESLLLVSVALLWGQLGALGRSPRIALLAAVAMMGAVPLALDLGTPVFPLLVLVLGAFRARSDLECGLLLGLAGLVAPRSWLLVPLLLARGRLAAVGAALGVTAAATGLAVAIHGIATVRSFWTGVLPAMLVGDFSGGNLRIDVFGNHAPAHLFAMVFPGATGLELSGIAVALVWAVGLLVVGALTLLHRSPGDPWSEAAVLASWMLVLIGVPVFGHEALLPLAIPAVALVGAALWEGRLDRRLAVPVGIALAVLLYPLEPLRELYQDVFAPGLPRIAPLVRETKPMALAAVAACTLWLSLPAHTE